MATCERRICTGVKAVVGLRLLEAVIVYVDTHGDSSMAPRVETARLLIDELDNHSVIEVPSQADLLLFLEQGNNKFRKWAHVLREDRRVMDNLDRCFTYDYSDRPIPFLPGLYWSMPRSRFDPLRVVATDSWHELNPLVLEQVLAKAKRDPSYLYSFRGFESHPVRQTLLSLVSEKTPITLTTRFWDYAEQEEARLDYLVEIRNTSFVLCPRGLGTSTLRVYETMELGRVPIIISDEWMPSPGPEWEQFSVRVPEAEIETIPELLRSLEPSAVRMGNAARSAWERWMRPGPDFVSRWLDGIAALIARRPPAWNAKEIEQSWRSHSFQWRHGIHPVQGCASRLRTVYNADLRRFGRAYGGATSISRQCGK